MIKHNFYSIASNKIDHSIFYPKPWNLVLNKLKSNENYIDDNKSDYDISVIIPTYNNINYLDENENWNIAGSLYMSIMIS